MKVVLDASAIVALLDGEPGGAAVADVIASGCSTSAVNLAEARDLLARRNGSVGGTDVFVDRGLVVVPCDLAVADQAADLRTAHYHPRDRAVSLADCIAVATASAVGGTLVSSDRDQLRVAVLAGVSIHRVANSLGVLPEP